MKTDLHWIKFLARRLWLPLVIFHLLLIGWTIARAGFESVHLANTLLFNLVLVAIPLCFGLVLADRPGAHHPHWKTLPVTNFQWFRSRITFSLICIVLPLTVFQLITWLLWGGTAETGLLSAVETAWKSGFFILLITSIAAFAKDWKWAVVILIVCPIVGYLGLLCFTLFFGSEWRKWNFPLCIVFCLLCHLLTITRKIQLLRWASLAAVCLFGTNYLLHRSSRTNSEPIPNPPELHKLSKTKNEYTQQVYGDFHLKKQPTGNFTDFRYLRVNDEFVEGFSSDRDYLVYAGSKAIAVSLGDDFFCYGRPAGKFNPDHLNGNKDTVRSLSANAFAYELVEEMVLPMEVGARSGQMQNFQAVIRDIQMKSELIEMNVRFKVSTIPARLGGPGKYFSVPDGSDKLFAVLVNESLKEAVHLFPSRDSGWDYTLSSGEQTDASYNIPIQTTWKMIWPDSKTDLELFQKWSEGAELRFYRAKILGSYKLSYQ